MVAAGKDSMNVVVAGGTGFIGRALCRSLLQDHHRVSVLSRDADRAGPLLGPAVTVYAWSETDDSAWRQAVASADAVINLAGASIADARWTAARKRLIYGSRIESTRRLADAMAAGPVRPSVF